MVGDGPRNDLSDFGISTVTGNSPGMQSRAADDFSLTVRSGIHCGWCIYDLAHGILKIESMCTLRQPLTEAELVLFDVWLEKWQRSGE